MKIVHEDKFLIAQWVAERVPQVRDIRDFGPFVSLGILDKQDNLIAGCVYNNYTGHDIHLTFAADSPKWATRTNIKRILTYPFEEAGCRRCSALVAKGNKRVRKLLTGLGFKEEGSHPCALDGEQTAVSLGLLPHKRKWPNGKLWSE